MVSGRYANLSFLLPILFALHLDSSNAHSSTQAMDEALSLETYMNQVVSGHLGMKGSELSSQGGMERSKEGELQLAYTAYANLNLNSDARLPQIVFLNYSRYNTNTYSFGVSKLTPYGLVTKLHYDIIYQEYINPTASNAFASLPGGASAISFPTSYIVASPVLEVTQSLWSNGFGRSTQASQELSEAQALSSSYNASYQVKTTLSQAEVSYWKLALARQVVYFQNEALERSRKMYELNLHRVQLHLAEDTDAFQAEANLRAKELELEMAMNDERESCRNFNSLRNIDSEKVVENLPSISLNATDDLKVPNRAQTRDDVKAAEQQARSTRANSKIALEKDAPTLDLSASLSLIGQGDSQSYTSLTDSAPASLTFRRPSYNIGLKFSAPLDFGLINQSRNGWKKEQVAAEHTYERRLFEQDQDWKKLQESFLDSKRRLELSKALEKVQKAKVENERLRLHRGRSTTFQVLSFEQDYLSAQLSRIRNQASALTLIAQMKVFGDSL